jgi:hypothetical protein
LPVKEEQQGRNKKSKEFICFIWIERLQISDNKKGKDK